MPLSSPAPKKSTRLDATLLDRILARPGWSRTILVRRVAAASLALTAVVMFARDAAATDHVRVLVAAHDLTPGATLGSEDVRIAEFSPTTVPDGALESLDDIDARTVAGPVRAGEPITDVRLLSSRLAESAIDAPDARIVPVRLSDAGAGAGAGVRFAGSGDGTKAADGAALRGDAMRRWDVAAVRAMTTAPRGCWRARLW